MSNCPGSIILDYTAYSSEILDDIGDDEEIDIFIFNPAGICVDMYTYTYGTLEAMGFEFELPITYSDHNVVVWQGLNSENYTSRRMTIGESYENFYLRLVYDTADASYNHVPDPLWASNYEPIEFCAKITRHRVYMTRIHTEIYLKVNCVTDSGNAEALMTDQYNAQIEAVNNVYQTDFTICDEESIALVYEAESEAAQTLTLSDSQEYATLGTLRITTDEACSLEVELEDGGKVTIAGQDYLDLVNYMLATKTDSSISDQAFLDLNKVWDISLTVVKSDAGSDDPAAQVGYVALSLQINGWVMWFSSSQLN